MRIRRAQKEQMRKPVCCHIVGKLPRALEQQIVFNTTNVMAAAKGAYAARASIVLSCREGYGYSVQRGPRGGKRHSKDRLVRRHSTKRTTPAPCRTSPNVT